ncbi:3 exoribonuclease family protein [Hirsutella rhossiliensis]|uniref:3 exoribonuclease family protein n=1 Tax=Hirsutella rhossiliensis TaxID=111463 RepID=A0A9P8MRD7_9HYPO|nr:3 exoribonuclease family protein [Hirsutella rhossiliensis]KAH0959084.1 3 exoribonuclease family protein [Hirsutella rhossiliensis]
MPRRPIKSATLRVAVAPRRASAHPSTHASKDETDDEAKAIPIASLTLNTPLTLLKTPKRRVPSKPFPFILLPSELRIKVYEHYFGHADDVLDLGPDNYKCIHKLLGLMRVCKQIHAEATHLFYSTRSFRIFPTYPGRYFKTKKPLLARLKPRQRQCLTSLQLRLGPGWNAPPRGWVVNDALGLQDCANVHKLSVYVECDPSDGFFKGFRHSEGFYEGFSRKLLANIIDDLPCLHAIEFDARSCVKKSGAMMHGLLDVAVQSQRLIRWGPERGWTDAEEDPVDPDPAALFEGLTLQGYVPNVVAAA